MPIYEYECSQGHHYERMEGFDAPAEQICPDCGDQAWRVLSLPVVIFRGPGFYSTDNPRPGRGNEESGKSSDASEKPKPGLPPPGAGLS